VALELSNKIHTTGDCTGFSTPPPPFTVTPYTATPTTLPEQIPASLARSFVSCKINNNKNCYYKEKQDSTISNPPPTHSNSNHQPHLLAKAIT
jgi:hypothetical protein